MFHDIDQDSSRSTFKFLFENYNIISLEQFIRAHNTRNKKMIPSKAIIITFDDGHINNYKLLPLLQDTKIPITIFLTAGIVGTNRHFWFKIKIKNFQKII